MVIDQGTKVEMTGTEIHFRTGVSVTGGAFLHAKIESVGICTQNMGGRYGETNQNILNQYEQNLPEEKQENENVSEKLNENFQIQIYPNPATENNIIQIKLFGSESAYCEMTDVTGRIISTTQIKQGENLISLPFFSKGIIIIKTTSNEGKTDFKKLLVH